MLAGQVDTTGASTSVDLIMKEKNKVIAASTLLALFCDLLLNRRTAT